MADLLYVHRVVLHCNDSLVGEVCVFISLRNGKASSVGSDIVASISTQDCTVISIQSQDEGVMDVIGVA